LKVDTKGYGGRKMKKTAGVYTNDEALPRQDLVISGLVEKFVTIRPQHANLRGFVGDPIKSTVTIIPEKNYPFKILNLSAKDGKYIKYQLEETKESDTTAYKINIENLKTDAGRYYDSIIIETDSKIRPQLNVRVYGYLRLRKTE
jgi:hypothetical protein